jgi:flagellar biosynthesis GTPase FlhF
VYKKGERLDRGNQLTRCAVTVANIQSGDWFLSGWQGIEAIHQSPQLVQPRIQCTVQSSREQWCRERVESYEKEEERMKEEEGRKKKEEEERRKKKEVRRNKKEERRKKKEERRKKKEEREKRKKKEERRKKKEDEDALWVHLPERMLIIAVTTR